MPIRPRQLLLESRFQTATGCFYLSVQLACLNCGLHSLDYSGQIIKMIFAENELAAEDTLSQPREAEVGMIGDDY